MPVPEKIAGDWAPAAYRTVAEELTSTIDLGGSASEIIDSLVHIHYSVYAAAERLKKRQGRRLWMGPRSFLDFIHHYVSLTNEKRSALEEEQRHLNVGLDKLKETVLAVEELRKSLAVKDTQLKAKNKEANDKLQRMVADQKQAEDRKVESERMQKELVRQQEGIVVRREEVEAELANAEPAVQDAKAAVSNIKKQHLTEVRSMGNPPAPVKNAMESVCIALGHKVDSWKTVQGIIRRDDFIASIVNFDTERQMNKAVRDKMRRDYLSKPDYNFEQINRASKACGPLAKWVIAQVEYSDILDKVGPLREEVNALSEEAERSQAAAAATLDIIAQTERDIARYKEEYAALISEVQAIKSEMERVQTRVNRSIQLLDSLGSEKQRWDSASKTFDTQMSTIVGDALLCAAFLTYAGYFDQQYREGLWTGWVDHLTGAEVKFKSGLSFTEYLSTADERLDWQSKGLPSDALATENAIMLQRFRRYPLLLDPSGQATAFLQKWYQDRKLTVSSFLDEAFVKNLESALRFGQPMLVQDVENLDPIVNPVLNGELRRTGGRVLIRVGTQEIDFSPSFTMFLSTRDPSVEFTPDVCSRVTFVNFTMTRESLQSQSQDQVLKAERPDTDKKRTDLMKLQGEFQLRLRHLEKSLLNALNASEGNILDDDKVIDTLETLKKEAREVTTKVEETEAIMQDVDAVTRQYEPLAKACSSLFFVLDQLNLVNHFYQFSLRFFLDIFDFVLRRNPHLQGVSEPSERLRILTRDLFLVVYKRTSRALAHRDHVMLGALLAQIWSREGSEPEALDSEEYDFLLEGGDVVGQPPASTGGILDQIFSPEQRQRVEAYKRLPVFRGLTNHAEQHSDEWREFLASSTPETAVPRFWPETTDLADLVRRILVVKCLRSDRIVQAMTTLVNTVFGADILADTAYDLKSIVSDEVGAQTPIALCSVPGFDASYRVDQLVRSTCVKCISVAMGSAEGFAQADQAISNGVRTGQWVLLKNVHLAPEWLSQLEKKLSTTTPNRNFRLFLTCETVPSIPVNFLRASRILMNEPPPGIKASMLDSLRGIAPSRLQKGPAESMRLFFLLSFLHATLTERLRYTPLGWSKTFEFNDSDAETALDTIDAWVGRVAKGRANIDPASVPWDALRSLIKTTVYGGKIDNETDQLLLDTFVNAIFTPAAYESAFPLVDNEQMPLIAPEGTQMDQFIAWVQKLPEQQPPQWLSLPPTAERVIATAQGAALLNKLVRMRELADDDDVATTAATTAPHEGAASSSAHAQPVWMKTLQQNAIEWLKVLPGDISKLTGTSSSIADPLFRFWAREHRTGASLLKTVRSDLEEVVSVCAGETRQNNHNRNLLNDLPKGVIPASWKQYATPKAMSLGLWIADLTQRLAQLESVTKENRYDRFAVVLGLLFSPGAYLTATRQAVAHTTRVSLENLKLDLRVNDGGRTENGFAIEGLKLEGADWLETFLDVNDGRTVSLSRSSILWLDGAADGANPTNTPSSATARHVPITVYLNGDRDNTLFHVKLPAAQGLPVATVAQRAVAVRAA
ncbi:cytoplasmic dynein heavy chain 2 [Ceraceosorus bombacis]|uniref:Dynein heavy chain, cytoplasmic n=1 Tax=Ceraceosorus bombacis TaxID=401625 RepID=A0A0P1BEH2_9BASI|nr:cytoplasmic dynein heavy chain 2 [Ceraceosorus bombacis]